MKYNFTLIKIVRTLLLALCGLSCAAPAISQTYTASLVESDQEMENGLYSALANNNNGDLFVARFKGKPEYFTGLTIDASNTMYTVERTYPIYTVSNFANASGTGTPIYSGLAEGFNTYPWGIVEHNGDLYVNDGSATIDINGNSCSGQELKPSPPNIHIVSIQRLNPTSTSTNASSVQYLLTFNGPANDVSASNFTATAVSGAITGMTIDAVTGSGNTRVVTVNTGTGNGILRLDMANVTGITPAVDNPMPYTSAETYLIDKTPPSGTVVINGDATYTNTVSVSLSMNVADGGGSGGLTMAFSQDGTNFSPFGPFASPVGYVLSGPDGPKTVYIRLRDEAGNEADIQDDIILDRTAPETAIVEAPPNLTNSFNASFTFTSNDPDATFEYQLDGSPFFPTGNPFNVFGLPAGTHNFTVRAKDPAGNVDPTPVTYTWTIDTGKPSVTSVGVPANGTYGVGQHMDFTVTFYEDVEVDDSGGIPYITLNIGGTTRNATYLSGSNSSDLVFRYTVAAGDLDEDGIEVGGPITLDGGIIKDLAGNEAILTLNSVGNTNAVLVDGVGPVVTSVDVPANSYYNEGDQLEFTVHFNEHVTVTGTPSIAVNIGGTIVSANYVSGSGTDALLFRHTVAAGENDDDGIALDANISLHSGAIRDESGNDATLTLNAVGNTSGILVNTIIPTVTLSGDVSVNSAWTMTITFSEAVTGFTQTDITATNASLSAFSTADNITFTVLVTPNADGQVTLDVPANVATNIGGNGNAPSNTLSYMHDDSAPAVTSVNVPANGTYKAGDVLEFTVHFGEDVVVNGNLSFPIIIGSTTRQATYVTSSGGSSLVFRYTVQNGDLDTDGIAVGNTINLNGGYITDISSNDALLALNNVDNTNSVLVDAVAPVVSSVSVPANGYYKAGQSLEFTVYFSEDIVRTGVPFIPITIGSTVVHATYVGLVGANGMKFTYVVQPGDTDTDGITVGNTINLISGTIKDAAGNNAVLALNNVANTGNVFVLTISPTVTFSGINGSNVAWTATFVFSHEVTGFTIDDIALTNAVASNFQVVSGTTYTALISPQVQGSVSVQVPANVAQDLAGNLNEASGTLYYLYDPNPPFITSVEVPANGYYKQGDVLNFTVNWNEIVRVNRTPSTLTLPVIIGAQTVQAEFIGGFGSDRLSFAYTVQAGDMDLDGIQPGTALQITDPNVRFTDQSNNPAVLTLNGVPNTSGIFVHTGRPSVTLSSEAEARVNAPFTITATFNEEVTQLAAGDFIVTNATVSNLQTIDNITYTLIVSPAADGAITINLPENVAENVIGNGNTASNTISRNYDGTAPLISADSFEVLENSPVGTQVGTLTASDASGSIENWTIATDGSGGAFALDQSGSVTVKDVAILNSHAGTTVTLGITVSDGLNTSAVTSINIEILAVNRPPTLDPIDNVSLCTNTEPHIMQLTGASAVEPHQTYSFTVISNQDFFDVLTVNASGLLTYQLKPSVTSGTATVTVTIKDDGGTANGGVDTLQRKFTITVNPLPVVTITSNKGNTVSKGDTIRLTASGGATYNWANVDGIISGVNNAVLTARALQNTTYTVAARSAAGCSATASINIGTIEDFKVDATNILTPNGDGRNDRFVIRNIDVYPDNELRVFDRAGRQVYQQRSYNNTWDGTLNGRPLAEGTYYYILTIEGGKKTAKGFITIIRDRY